MSQCRVAEDLLIDKVLAGDHKAFNELIIPIRKLVYHKALKAVKDADIAEDIAQEVIIRVYRKLHTFRGESSLSTWVFVIARNTLLMYFRSERRRRSSALSELPEGSIERLLDGFRAPLQNQEESYDTKSIINSFNSAIKIMPTKYSQVIVSWVNGKSLEEIGSDTGMSRSAVKSRMHRARMQLKSHMKPHDGAAA